MAQLRQSRTISIASCSRTAYLSMIGLFLGYLAEESRLLRAETAAIAGMLGRVRADAGATRVLTDIAAEVRVALQRQEPAAGGRESIDRSRVPLGLDHRVERGAGDDAGRFPRRRRASLPVRLAERDARDLSRKLWRRAEPARRTASPGSIRTAGARDVQRSAAARRRSSRRIPIGA